jgi:hypothetical protein
MDAYSVARLSQQVYAERVQAASEPPIYPHQEYQGRGHGPVAGRATAGWRTLLGRIATRRAEGLGAEPPTRPGRALGV